MKITIYVAATVTALAGTLMLSACAPIDAMTQAGDASSTPSQSSTPSSDPQIIVPEVSTLSALEGTTVSLNAGDFYDVALPSGTADTWTASSDPAGVVEVLPADSTSDGSPVLTLAAVGAGSTTVTLTDGTTTVAFGVTVTGK